MIWTCLAWTKYPHSVGHVSHKFFPHLLNACIYYKIMYCACKVSYLIAGENNASLGFSHLSDTATVTEKLDNELKGLKRSPKPMVADDMDMLGMD